VDHYRARMPRGVGLDRRTVGLALTEAEWSQLEGLAREKEWSLAMVASQVVRLALRQRSITPAARPGVYYDAQGREHEEGDMRA
jgi:hypothetical protein